MFARRRLAVAKKIMAGRDEKLADFHDGNKIIWISGKRFYGMILSGDRHFAKTFIDD